MALINGLECCGVGEIYGLSNDEDAKESMEELIRLCDIADIEYCPAHLIFTQASDHNRPYGTQFAKLIERHGLGTVVRTSKPKVNPGSGHLITMWMWTPNVRALQAYARRNKITPAY